MWSPQKDSPKIVLRKKKELTTFCDLSASAKAPINKFILTKVPLYSPIGCKIRLSFIFPQMLFPTFFGEMTGKYHIVFYRSSG